MQLPEHLTIIEIAEWKEQIKSTLDNVTHLEIDVSPLKRVDTSGLQLLLAIKLAVEEQGGAIQWKGESDSLGQGAYWLGMSSLLGIKS